MLFPEPKSGLVICYSYLWYNEYMKGQEEGLKDRPCAIILSVKEDSGKWIVTVAPITHSRPELSLDAVEIPLVTKKRLGLDNDQSWIVISEVNRFKWPGPDLRTVNPNKSGECAYGYLPPRLFAQIKNSLIYQANARKLKTVSRTE